METLILALGTFLCIMLGVGMYVGIKLVRELIAALQDHKESVLTGALGICRRLESIADIQQASCSRIEALTDEIEVIKKNTSHDSPDA